MGYIKTRKDFDLTAPKKCSVAFLKWGKRIVVGLKNLWLMVGITLIFLIIIEVVINVSVKNSQRENVLFGFHAGWSPYVYWKTSPLSQKGVNVDNQGLRKTWNTKTDFFQGTSSKTLKIFMFGGSAVWGLSVDDDNTIPSLLSKSIANLGIGYVEVTNFGQNGYVTTQELILLLRELQKKNVPDIVVFYDGFNDVSFRSGNSEPGVTMLENQRKREFNILGDERRKALYKEAFLSFVRHTAMFRLTQVISDSFKRNRNSKENILEEETLLPQQFPEEVLQVYVSNKNIVEAIGQSMGFDVFYYWQPSIFSKHHKTSREREISDGYKLLGTLYMETTSLINQSKELSNDNKFHDLSEIFHDDSQQRYLDVVHNDIEGNKIIAKRIVEDLMGVVRNRLKRE